VPVCFHLKNFRLNLSPPKPVAVLFLTYSLELMASLATRWQYCNRATQVSALHKNKIRESIMNTKLRAPIPEVILTLELFLPVPRARGGTLYVDASSRTAAASYDSWQSAAVTVQDAIDAASTGDEIVLTNGAYGTGGRVVYGMATNRVAVVGPFTARGVNWPQFTLMQGRQVLGSTNGGSAIGGVYFTDGAVQSGFTVTNGATAVWEPGWDLL
jgi:hypothetical protein